MPFQFERLSSSIASRVSSSILIKKVSRVCCPQGRKSWSFRWRRESSSAALPQHYNGFLPVDGLLRPKMNGTTRVVCLALSPTATLRQLRDTLLTHLEQTSGEAHGSRPGATALLLKCNNNVHISPTSREIDH